MGISGFPNLTAEQLLKRISEHGDVRVTLGAKSSVFKVDVETNENALTLAASSGLHDVLSDALSVLRARQKMRQKVDHGY